MKTIDSSQSTLTLCYKENIVKYLTMILAFTAFGVNAQTFPENQENETEQEYIEVKNTKPPEPADCEFENNFFLASLRRGTSDYRFYMDMLAAQLRRCGKDLTQIGVSLDELKVMEKKSCVAAATKEFRYYSGHDPVGEKIYLKNLAKNLEKCGVDSEEIRQITWRNARETRHRTYQGASK